ncbi:NADP-dependent oxidoreductase [Sorangium cellulosum]|uniref:NADP-dependent oxidoreductase n=1 Tax=Sorangium cellulosum TaxID=56 RepID=A0A2L0FBA9_SORCE|nr:NADP-dependent oxidoreductase [Sorangium cellulosum]AUX48885.1 NADP-dependent oxidoreductase [Sorangium cellulosum]
MSTTSLTNRQYLFKSRPEGMPDRSHFELRTSPVREPGDGEIIVRTRYLSVDPTNRVWMSDVKQYMPPVSAGEVMRAGGAGVVESSRHPDYRAGDLVTGLLGWQDYNVGRPEEIPFLAPLPKLDAPLSAFLCPLHLTGGLTAYFGLFETAKPKAGETLVVSAAAGSVGSLVGQMGKIAGCRVVGIAGSEAGCKYVTEELGFDACINYKTEDVAKGLERECPNGVDVDFENVGGEILDAVLDKMNLYGRVAVCGLIATYNDKEPRPGPTRFPLILMQRLRVEGFIVSDYHARFPEAVEKIYGWMKEGKIKWREHVVEGLENAPEALQMLFLPNKVGKLLIKVSD